MDSKWKVNGEQQYLLEESMVQKINKNNIPIRSFKSQNSQNKQYAVYVQQLIYLLMSTVNTQNETLNRNKVIGQLYANLTQEGYDSFDCVWFYLKIRKASKILYRNPISNDLACFRVFKNTEQYKQNKSNQMIAIANNKQAIRSILHQKIIQQSATFKLYICDQMDGIAVKLSKPFKLGHLCPATSQE